MLFVPYALHQLIFCNLLWCLLIPTFADVSAPYLPSTPTRDGTHCSDAVSPNNCDYTHRSFHISQRLPRPSTHGVAIFTFSCERL